MKKNLRLVCISDTHKKHEELDNMPDGDVLVCAGDITSKGEINDALRFNEWVGKLQKYKYAVLIAGNHDFCFQEKFLRELMRNCTFLHDSSTVINGVKFTGSPWTPKFGNWAFMRPRNEMDRIWAEIPRDTEVLITHGPPKGIMDEVPRFIPAPRQGGSWTVEHTGCEELRRFLKFQIKPKVHIFGHIHEGYGILEEDGITYVNASVVDAKYDLTRKPIVIDI